MEYNLPSLIIQTQTILNTNLGTQKNIFYYFDLNPSCNLGEDVTFSSLDKSFRYDFSTKYSF